MKLGLVGTIVGFIMVGGKKVLSPIRQETVSIRGIVAGEYTVNVYQFAALTGKPVPVSVPVEKRNPTVQVGDGGPAGTLRGSLGADRRA